MNLPLAILLAAASPSPETGPELLETLVKLASAGTSGICVLAIFWCGLSIMRLPNDAPHTKHVTLRFFMGTCVLVAIISAGTTFGAGYWDYRRVASLRNENRQLVASNTEQREQVQQLRGQVTLKNTRIQELEKTIANVRARGIAIEAINPGVLERAAPDR